MHLKIPLSSRGLKLSNCKPGCRVSALHFFVKQIPPMAFWHRAHSDKCYFQLLIPGSTPASQLKSVSGFEIVTKLAGTGKWPKKMWKMWKFFTSVVYRSERLNTCFFQRRESRFTNRYQDLCYQTVGIVSSPCKFSASPIAWNAFLKLHANEPMQKGIKITTPYGHQTVHSCKRNKLRPGFVFFQVEENPTLFPAPSTNQSNASGTSRDSLFQAQVSEKVSSPPECAQSLILSRRGESLQETKDL